MKNLLGGLALSALLAAPAIAADIPARVPVRTPAAAPVAVSYAYSWSGCYIGVQGGYQFGDDHTRETVTATGVFNNFDQSWDTRGGMAGGHLGCQWQGGAFVIGVEGDFEWSGLNGGYTLANGNGTDFESKWQGSVRGRFGFASGPALFYVTGGVAFVNAEYAYFTVAVREAFTTTRTGWTAGGGIEYGFGGGWSGRIEYRYTDLGSFSNNSLVAFPGLTYTHDPKFHAVRGGLTYRWGGGPVVARY